jgi:hypothetical protein
MKIPSQSVAELGVVPTHLGFVGGSVPDDEGRLPRNAEGELVIAAGMRDLVRDSAVRQDAVMLTFFAGTNEDDVTEMIDALKALDLDVHLVLMVGGVDPMSPADEDGVLALLLEGLTTAKKHGVKYVSSTSVEEWMKPGAEPRTGADLDAAVKQNVAVHARAYREAGLAESCVESWSIEFLRPGEFQTFTNLARLQLVIKGLNDELGVPFFKILVDAAHCGDSDLNILENEALIAELAASDHLGVFHCSAKTTRGCLSTDDGWIGALLTAAAKTGKLKHVFVEIFRHDDLALGDLRDLEPGHGVDTVGERGYHQVTVDGLKDVALRLNNLVARGMLAPRA